MRAAAARQPVGREAMRERQRRGRTATPPIRARYPGLDSLQIEFEFTDHGKFVPSRQVTVLHPSAPAFFCFACPFGDCDGEFDLTSAVDLIARSGQLQASGEMRCAGTRHRVVACTLCLEYSISPHRNQAGGVVT
jgi:hypothetical protein